MTDDVWIDFADAAYMRWVLASLDLFDPDYRPGQEVTTQLHLINDSWHDCKVHVDLLLTRECPEYIPEAKCYDQPVNKWSHDFSLSADSIDKVPVQWRLPAEEGYYWLTARTTGVAGRAVLSQRMVRAISPPKVPEALKRSEFLVLGGDHTTQSFFRSRHLRTASSAETPVAGKHVVVIWDASRLSSDERRQARILVRFLREGGKVVVLSSSSWDWPELCDVKVTDGPRFSRVFPHEDVDSSILDGIDPQWLIRWNGLPGTVAQGALGGPGMERATKILWAREPKTTVTAVVPAVSGGGGIVFAQLDLKDRLDPSQPCYDPVAERVLLRLLEPEIH